VYETLEMGVPSTCPHGQQQTPPARCMGSRWRLDNHGVVFQGRPSMVALPAHFGRLLCGLSAILHKVPCTTAYTASGSYIDSNGC
jgi:hypothetical protein